MGAEIIYIEKEVCNCACWDASNPDVPQGVKMKYNDERGVYLCDLELHYHDELTWIDQLSKKINRVIYLLQQVDLNVYNAFEFCYHYNLKFRQQFEKAISKATDANQRHAYTQMSKSVRITDFLQPATSCTPGCNKMMLWEIKEHVRKNCGIPYDCACYIKVNSKILSDLGFGLQRNIIVNNSAGYYVTIIENTAKKEEIISFVNAAASEAPQPISLITKMPF
jgi:hypothetical protein